MKGSLNQQKDKDIIVADVEISGGGTFFLLLLLVMLLVFFYMAEKSGEEKILERINKKNSKVITAKLPLFYATDTATKIYYFRRDGASGFGKVLSQFQKQHPDLEPDSVFYADNNELAMRFVLKK